MNIKLFIVFYALQLLYAIPHFNTCKNITFTTVSIFLLHHVIDVYGYFGIFINETLFDYELHLFMILVVMAHWYTNNYRCEITIKLNELCDRDKNIWEHNIVGYLAETTGIYYLHTYLLLGLLAYDGYKIYTLISN
jgi:hypothetical protein